MPTRVKGPTGIGVRLFSEFVLSRASGGAASGSVESVKGERWLPAPACSSSPFTCHRSLLSLAGCRPGPRRHPRARLPGRGHGRLHRAASSRLRSRWRCGCRSSPRARNRPARGRRSPASSSPATRSSGVTPRPWATCSPRCPASISGAAASSAGPSRSTTRRAARSSAEYYLDGLPYVAAGVDSVAVDPALFSISFLDRIEVERWPGLLRVYLFTRRHDRLAPRSRIAIARGDGDFARYEGALERRLPERARVRAGRPTTSTPPRRADPPAPTPTPRSWLQGSYIPAATGRRPVPAAPVGARTGDRSSSTTRRRTTRSAAGFDATRTDAQLRLSWRARPTRDRAPGRICSTARPAGTERGSSSRSTRSADALAYRAPTFAVGASAFHRTRWTALDVRGTLGWNPVPAFTASAEAVHQHHYGGRNADYVSLSAGLQPVRGLALTGSARLGEMVAAPAILADTAQDISRLRGGHRVESARGSDLRLGLSRTARVQSVRVRGVPPHPVDRARSPETEWVTAARAHRAAPLDHPGGMVQRSAGWDARGHPADPLADRRDHSIEVPAPVPQRHLRPEAPTRAWKRGAPG